MSGLGSKKILVVFVFLFVFIFQPLAAEETNPSEKAAEIDGQLLTLDRAIEIALEKNLQILAGLHGSEAARWSKYYSYTGWLPTVDFSTNFSYLDNDSVDRINDPIKKTARTFGTTVDRDNLIDNETYGSSVSIAQPILNGGAEIGAIMAGIANHREKKEQLRSIVLETVLKVKTAYIGAVKTREVWITASKARDLAQETQRLFESRYRNGQLARADLLRWEAEAAGAEGNELEAQNAYELAKIALVNLLGESLQANFQLPEFSQSLDLDYYQKLLEESGVLAEQPEQMTSVIDEHPSILRMDALIDLGRANRVLAWSEVLPNLNFSWTYSWAADGDLWLDGDKGWTAAVFLRVPLFHSLRGTFGILEARRQSMQAKVYREDLARTFLQRALSVMRTMRTALLRVKATRKSLNFAEENLKVQKTRQDLGQSTNLELLDAQLTYTTARSGFISAVSDFFLAQAEWEYLHNIENEDR